jgi:hypothetical protein
MQLIKVMMRLHEAEPDKQGIFLKSLVGLKLRDMDPVVYGDKAARAEIFDRAIEDGVIAQYGAQGEVTVQLITREYYSDCQSWNRPITPSSRSATPARR